MMDGEYYFEHDLSETEKLTVSPITNAEAAEADCEFCDGFGYYLCSWSLVEGKWEKRLLAKMIDADAASSLWTVLRATKAPETTGTTIR